MLVGGGTALTVAVGVGDPMVAAEDEDGAVALRWPPPQPERASATVAHTADRTDGRTIMVVHILPR
jgi:hypothetical protein